MTRLRNALAESYVADVAIAVLVLWFLNYLFLATWGPLARVAERIATAIAIWGRPAHLFGRADAITLHLSSLHFIDAVKCIAVAWALSFWLYDLSPFAALRLCAIELKQEHD